MKALLIILTVFTLSSSWALAASEDTGACVSQVTDAVQGPDMINVVDKVHVAKDQQTYVVIYYGDSGDEEQGSIAYVHVDPTTCTVLSIEYKK